MDRSNLLILSLSLSLLSPLPPSLHSLILPLLSPPSSSSRLVFLSVIWLKGKESQWRLLKQTEYCTVVRPETSKRSPALGQKAEEIETAGLPELQTGLVDLLRCEAPVVAYVSALIYCILSTKQLLPTLYTFVYLVTKWFFLMGSSIPQRLPPSSAFHFCFCFSS